jgi:DUF4097 and DUF4098 domain-containing protein YvlB
MRRRSFVGPVFLILIGALFLANNLVPDLPVFRTIAVYWPFLLIAWGVLRLIEILSYAATSRPLPRTGLSGGEVVLIVFICTIGSGLYAAHRRGHMFRLGPFGPRTLEIFGEQYDFSVAGSKEAGAVPRIFFENFRGNLRVTGGDGAEIKVSGRKSIRAYSRSDAEQADRESPLEMVTEGDRLVVRTNQQKVSGARRISIDLEVAVPRGSTIEGRGTYGDFDITDVAGAVEINSDNAGVRLNKIGGDARVSLRRSDIIRAINIKGNVELQSGRGNDVELENILGQVSINGSFGGTLEFKNLAKPLHFESRQTDLRVEALPGRISMDLGEFTAKNVVGPMRLVTKSRDIKIEEFTQSLELQTERGDISLRLVRVPLPKIEAHSQTGNIDLALPERAKFDLTATTNRGEARNDFGPAIQVETDGRSASLKGAVGEGPPIVLSTQRGSVAVRKAGATPAPEKASF